MAQRTGMQEILVDRRQLVGELRVQVLDNLGVFDGHVPSPMNGATLRPSTYTLPHPDCKHKTHIYQYDNRYDYHSQAISPRI
ncbi:hypothetical protein GLI01_10180 [Gluconacetobacter liquefaciens]|nr:hypothetical protein GLI01_10180 [Gluconacetobacter liquefaciens]